MKLANNWKVLIIKSWLQIKKYLLDNLIVGPKKGIDEMAIVAEKQSKLELLSKSNALKRAVPKKQVKLDACLKEKKRLI